MLLDDVEDLTVKREPVGESGVTSGILVGDSLLNNDNDLFELVVGGEVASPVRKAETEMFSDDRLSCLSI